jgi:hypothetical protein
MNSTSLCVSMRGSAVVMNDSAVVLFGSGDLDVGYYNFTVKVSKGTPDGLIPHHYRVASTSALIRVVAGQPPSVLMSVSSVKVNPGARTTLQATVDTHGSSTVAVTLAWTFPDMTTDQIRDTVLLSRDVILTGTVEMIMQYGSD